MQILSDLRVRFPMVCFKTWTPDDFYEANNGPDDKGNRGVADWNDDVYVLAAQKMTDLIRERESGDWHLLRKATLS